MKLFNVIALVLLLIGGLNWGLVGFFDVDLVSVLFGTTFTTAHRERPLCELDTCLFTCSTDHEDDSRKKPYTLLPGQREQKLF